MVYILPDSQAIDLYKSNKETLEILDGGYAEEEPPREATVQELVMGEVKQEEPEEQEEPEISEEEKLKAMSLVELRVLAKRLNIKWCSKMNKKELIPLIIKGNK